MNDCLEGLNKEQYQAATTINGPALILAGAGTGKTKMLVSRVSYMLQEGILPENILLLTFTNKAANEMKERIASFIGEEVGNKVLACTFHSFCSKFLRKYSRMAGIKNSFTIMDDSDCTNVIKGFVNDVKEEMKNDGVKEELPKVPLLLKVQSQSVYDMVSLSEAAVANKLNPLYVVKVLNAYQQFKKERSLMDYDDLLFYTVKILEENPLIRRAMDSHYRYIMCDEYQDTNFIQDRILELLSTDYQNLAVVGDDNQSIYNFRGAKIENILSFEKRHPGCQKIMLYENYRSTQEILDVSNEVMAYAKEGVPKKLKGQTHGEKAKILVFEDKDAEAKHILDEIVKGHKQGRPYKDFSIIIRNSYQSAYVEHAFATANIPFVKFGGLKFFSKEVIRNVMAYIRIALNDKDEVAWLQVLSLYPGIGESTARQIAARVSESGADVLVGAEFFDKKYRMYLEEVHSLLSQLSLLPLKEQLVYIIRQYYEPMMERTIQKSKAKDKDERLCRLKESMDDAEILIEMSEKYVTVKEFVDEIYLAFQNPDPKDDCVTITTIHSAKGLEYDTVFLIGPVQGEFPRTMVDCTDDRESLRCLYVALTRARRELRICVTEKGRSFSGTPTVNTLSHHLDYKSVIKTCTPEGNLENVAMSAAS